jgi:hypothetical protein
VQESIIDSSLKMAEIKIFDVNGRTRHSTSTIDNRSLEIDISEFTNGIYVIQVRSEEGLYFTKRLVKSSY